MTKLEEPTGCRGCPTGHRGEEGPPGYNVSDLEELEECLHDVVRGVDLRQRQILLYLMRQEISRLEKIEKELGWSG